MIVEDHHVAKGAQQHPPFADPDANLEEAKQLIVDHPIASVGGAFVVGVLLGLLRPRARGGVVRTAISGLAMTLLRDAVLKQVTNYAGSWIDMKSREEMVSRQRETEAFLDH